MRNALLLLALVLSSCTKQNPVVLVPQPAEVVVESTDAQGYAAKWSAAPTARSDRMLVLTWACTFKNTGIKATTHIRISCVDKKGAVHAEWDQPFPVAAGATVTKTGVFDVPAAELAHIDRVLVSCVSQ